MPNWFWKRRDHCAANVHKWQSVSSVISHRWITLWSYVHWLNLLTTAFYKVYILLKMCSHLATRCGDESRHELSNKLTVLSPLSGIHSSFPHTSTFSAPEVSYKNVLYKFTVIVIIIINTGPAEELSIAGIPHKVWIQVSPLIETMCVIYDLIMKWINEVTLNYTGFPLLLTKKSSTFPGPQTFFQDTVVAQMAAILKYTDKQQQLLTLHIQCETVRVQSIVERSSQLAK